MNIIGMAKNAGFTELEFFGNKVGTNVTECLERFAALVLEEAAKVCDGVYYQNIGPDHGEVRYGITACSVSIREKARALKGAKE